MNKACFFDRDGVLIEEENYLSDPEKVRLCGKVPEAIRLMKENAYKIVVVSNQSGIARGYFGIDELKSIERRINELLAVHGVSIDAVYYCFHHVKGTLNEYAIDCECRKPRPGMLLKAAADLDLNLADSVMIGDKISDLEAGFNAGCKAAALVRTGHGAEQQMPEFPGKTVFDTDDILSAAQSLLRA